MTRETEKTGTTNVTSEMLLEYRKKMADEEKSELTQEKYMRDLQKFRKFLDGRPPTKELTIQLDVYKRQA